MPKTLCSLKSFTGRTKPEVAVTLIPARQKPCWTTASLTLNKAKADTSSCFDCSVVFYGSDEDELAEVAFEDTIRFVGNIPITLPEIKLEDLLDRPFANTLLERDLLSELLEAILAEHCTVSIRRKEPGAEDGDTLILVLRSGIIRGEQIIIELPKEHLAKLIK